VYLNWSSPISFDSDSSFSSFRDYSKKKIKNNNNNNNNNNNTKDKSSASHPAGHLLSSYF